MIQLENLFDAYVPRRIPARKTTVEISKASKVPPKSSDNDEDRKRKETRFEHGD
jgi:hypothetical protein